MGGGVHALPALYGSYTHDLGQFGEKMGVQMIWEVVIF